MTRIVVGLALSLGLAAAASAQEIEEGNFRRVKPQVFEREKKDVPDIWVLDFKFRNPRYIMVDIPGQGRRLVWYMTYEVVNRSDKPRLFIPQFTIVTDKGEVFTDIVLPRAEKAVMNREDPTQKLFNSVSISEQPIPPTPPEALPNARYGVVFWEGIDMGKTKAFTVFVTGLSNGYVKVEDPKTKKVDMLRKTLKLDFAKPGDSLNPDEREIRYVGPPAWSYR